MDVALTRQLLVLPRRQQRLLECIPLIWRQQPRVDNRDFSLKLERTAVWPGDFQLGMRVVPA